MWMLSAQTHPDLASKLPRPVSTLALLLLATFTPMFVLSFVEPQFIFFAFDAFDWSTTQVGLILFAYGLSIISVQLMLGGISDSRFDRRWVIAVGIFALSAFYWGMTFLANFPAIFVAAAVSGIGHGLMTPAIGAFMLDLAAPHQRATIMGLRSSASSLGAFVGPALAFVVSRHLEPTTLFASAGIFALLIASISMVGLRAKPASRLEVEAYRLRSLAAGATLRGLAIQSSVARVS
jgi:MFS family permease